MLHRCVYECSFVGEVRLLLGWQNCSWKCPSSDFSSLLPLSFHLWFKSHPACAHLVESLLHVCHSVDPLDRNHYPKLYSFDQKPGHQLEQPDKHEGHQFNKYSRRKFPFPQNKSGCNVICQCSKQLQEIANWGHSSTLLQYQQGVKSLKRHIQGRKEWWSTK